MKCIICNENVNLVLSLDSRFSVSSLGKALDAQAKIYLCSHCSHCQTIPSIDLFEYYSKEYKTLSVSFEEDDLYMYELGKPVYRNEHQAKTLIEKFEKINSINDKAGPVLDFGCGKSLVMKHLMSMTHKQDVYLYDVSEDYVRFWDSFIPPSQYSCFDLPEAWNGYFTLVTSFFSLEHVPDPLAELKKIYRLLKPSGYVYIIVPNMYSANISDMLVIDHIQHYSETSMKLLLSLSGFELIEADHTSHIQGSVYIAKPASPAAEATIDPVNLANFIKHCEGIALFWKSVNDSIHTFEYNMNEKGVDRYYIAGAGFLGTYVSLQLQHSEKLKGFIDSNQHKQVKGWQGKKVFAPGTVDWNPSTGILSGFNPEQVRTILPGLLPKGSADAHLWTLNKVKNAEHVLNGKV
jgi:SAM-dependent methyltransferase